MYVHFRNVGPKIHILFSIIFNSEFRHYLGGHKGGGGQSKRWQSVKRGEAGQKSGFLRHNILFECAP